MSALDVEVGMGIDWARLELPNEDPIILMSEDGNLMAYDLIDLDFGYPEVREVTRKSPMTDGEEDTTTLHGSRVLTMTVRVFEYEGKGPNHWVLRLRRYAHPSLRPIFAYKFNGIDEPRRMVVRPENHPLEFSISRPSHIEVPLTFKVPTGRAESYEEQQVIIRAEQVGGGAGRTYPLVYDRMYPNEGPLSGAFIRNKGNARANPIIRIYGPVTNPAVYNDTLSEQHGHTMGYVFDSLTIANGDYVEINSERRTAELNGIRGNSVLHTMDYEHSAWWSLPKGESQIRYVPETYDSPSQVHIFWRNTYL